MAPLTRAGRLDIDLIGDTIARVQTAVGRCVVLLCNPHNPTGTVHTRSELESLARVTRDDSLGSALIAELEYRLLARGVRRMSALLPEGETGAAALANSGFTARAGITYYEKVGTVSPRIAEVLARLGGAVPPAGLWRQVARMAKEKTLIERRIVLPLSRSVLTAEHGVVPPRAVVLFGHAGKGKTTFARSIASRLGWPFVELFPSRLASNGGGLAAGIGEMFGSMAKLDHVVVFIDEVEEVSRPGAGQGRIR